MKTVGIFSLILIFASFGLVSSLDCSKADYNTDGEVNFKDTSLFELCYNQDASQVQMISQTESVNCEFWDFNNDGHVGDEDITEYQSTYLKECRDLGCIRTIGELTIAPLGQWTSIDKSIDILSVQILRGDSEDFKLVGTELKIVFDDSSEVIESWEKESFFGKNSAKLFEFPGYSNVRSLELFPKVVVHGEEVTCDSVSTLFGPSLLSPCEESWDCNDWGSCGSNYQTRGCFDVNRCGTTINRPPLSKNCEEEVVGGSDEFYCKDSDGGKDIYISATTFGFSSKGEYFSYWDSCEGATKVKEFYCDGKNTLPAFDIINCPDGCDRGRCLGKSISESYCDDSDGGENIYERGLVRGNVYTSGEFLIRAHYDECIEENYINEQTTKGTYVSSCSGDNCYIKEHFSKIQGTDGREVCRSETIKCFDGCKDGACVGDKPATDENIIVPNQSEETSANEEVVSIQVCNGCLLEDTCYDLGYRKDGNYCNESKVFSEYKNSQETCENNFECKSNLCIDSECISEGLFQKILNWFKRIFG